MALVAGVALAGYLIGRNRVSVIDSGSGSLDEQLRPAARGPLGGEPMPLALPSLEESDAVVRGLVGALSSHPRVAAWLTTRGLIRNFVVVVTNIANGTTPAVHLQRLRPSGSFQVIEIRGNLYIDPRGYDRYSSFAAAVASLDVKGTARLYTTLKPLIEEGSLELGTQDSSFDRTLERAIVRLLGTPILTDPVPVEPQGIGYVFWDADVEALTPAQKQFLRFGPRNVRLIQATLRNIAVALGIPAHELPILSD